jgi:hypothetical protein
VKRRLYIPICEPSFEISVDNGTSGCKVSVKVNFVSPYHDALPIAEGAQNNSYSKWSFTLTPAYTSIQPGQNKIIAKFSCAHNPNLYAVLLLDDEFDIVALFMLALERQGFHVAPFAVILILGLWKGFGLGSLVYSFGLVSSWNLSS